MATTAPRKLASVAPEGDKDKDAAPAPAPAPAPAAVEVPAGTAATQFGTKKIIDLDEKFTADGSSITDRAAASALFDATLPEIATWIEGDRVSRGATKRYLDVSLQLRTLCLNNEQAIDWAGNTEAYKVLWSNRVNNMLTASIPDEKQRNRFKAAVRVYNANNDYGRRFMLDYLAAHDKKLADDVVVADDGTAKIGSLMAAAMTEQASKQLTKDGSSVLQGFDPSEYAKEGETVGLPKSKQGDSSSGNGDDERKPSPKWEQVRGEINKKDKDTKVPHLAALPVATELHHLVSSAAVVLFGNGDEKFPFTTTAFRGWSKPKTVAEWKKIAALATAVVNGLEDAEKVDYAKDLKPLLWTPSK